MRDIHQHLSGSTSYRVLWEVVQDSGLKLGIRSYREFVTAMSLTGKGSLEEYLHVLHFLDKAQSSPMAVKACTYDAFVSSYEVGCDYLELRMNITKRSADGAIDLDALLVNARSGYELAKTRFGIDGGLILCLGWDCSDDANIASFRKALAYAGKGVIGIDVAGSYSHATPGQRQAFAGFYRAAKATGLMTTCHAGEVDHPGLEEELDWALNQLEPDRIGHGIKVLQFPDLIKKAQSLKPTFEICISSNLATGAVKKLEDFKAIFRGFEEHGLKYVICTDATHPLETDIRRENELYNSLKG